MLLQTISFAHHSTTDKPEETSTNLKEPVSKKPTPDLESKAIGLPDSRHKSKGTPQLTTHLSRHLKPIQTRPTKNLMPNSKTKNRWNDSTNQTSSNLNIPKQATDSKTTSIVLKTYSTPSFELLYRLTSRGRKISIHFHVIRYHSTLR